MPRPVFRAADLMTLVRFGLAGAANTLVGLAVIAGLDLGLHVQPHLANAAGYGVGVCLGFVLNRGFVFRSGEPLGATGLRYLAAVALAFALNQGVLTLAGRTLGAAPGARLLAQIAGMASYTLFMFGLCRFWVFRRNTTQG